MKYYLINMTESIDGNDLETVIMMKNDEDHLLSYKLNKISTDWVGIKAITDSDNYSRGEVDVCIESLKEISKETFEELQGYIKQY